MTLLNTTARRVSAAGLAVAATLTAAPAMATGTGAASAAGGAGAGKGLDRYYNQQLSWGSCAKGPDDAAGRGLDKAKVQCADVLVPLDYADPRGRTITVAVSRLKATDTRHRIGSILLNNGGPGGPSVESPPDVRKAMKKVGPRYDIIGFDPRFVGRSTPLNCGWTVGTDIFSAGMSRASFERQVAFKKDLADKCRATNGSVLPHISTRNTARDMDVIRGALGERKISFLGYSYGSYLGTVYTQMFPGKYDRFVLDGALAPDDYSPRLLKGSERENQKAISDWAAWAAKRHDAYGLGRTRAAVLATVDRIVAASARAPLTVGTGKSTFRLDDTQVPFILISGNSDDTPEARTALAEQISVLAKAAAGKPTELSPAFAALLKHALTEGGPNSAAQTAIICGDKPAPRGVETYWKDIQRIRAAHPILGPLTNNISTCAFWDRPREKPTQVKHDAKMLIVAATGDTRTTYRSSVDLHTMLPGSKLLTLKGANRHALYGLYGNDCVDDKVNSYLATGKLPAKDQTCVKPAG